MWRANRQSSTSGISSRNSLHALQAERGTALKPMPIRQWRTLYLVAWIIWLCDLGTKVWAQNALSSSANVKVLGSFLQFTYIRNSGAAFSFGTGGTIFFSFFAIAVLLFIVKFAPTITSKGWALVGGLLLGGILGNLSDRIFRSPGFLRGYVIDWIQLPHWPVFNIADSAIVIAACTATLLSFKNIPPTHPTKVI